MNNKSDEQFIITQAAIEDNKQDMKRFFVTELAEAWKISLHPIMYNPSTQRKKEEKTRTQF